MLVPVDPRFLSREWGPIRAGLEKILDKNSDDWIPEDLYAEVKAGTTGLFFLEYGGQRIGFIGLQMWPHYHNGPRLFIRALWIAPGLGIKNRADIYDDLDAFAREKGIQTMRQLSPRRWDGDGWTLKQYVYERDVGG